MKYTKNKPVQNNSAILKKAVMWERFMYDHYVQDIKLYKNMYYFEEYMYLFDNFACFKNLTTDELIKIGTIIKYNYKNDGYPIFNYLVKNYYSILHFTYEKYTSMIILESSNMAEYSETFVYDMIKSETIKYNVFVNKKFSFKIHHILELLPKLYILDFVQKSNENTSTKNSLDDLINSYRFNNTYMDSSNKKNRSYELYFCYNSIWTTNINEYFSIKDKIVNFYEQEQKRTNLIKNIDCNKLNSTKINTILNFLKTNCIFPLIKNFDTSNDIFCLDNLHFNISKCKMCPNTSKNLLVTTTGYKWKLASTKKKNKLSEFIDLVIEDRQELFKMFYNILFDNVTKLYVFTGSLYEILIFTDLIKTTLGNYVQLIDSKHLNSESELFKLKCFDDVKNLSTYYKKKLLLFYENFENEINSSMVDKFINCKNYSSIKNLPSTIIISTQFKTNVPLCARTFNKIVFINFKPYDNVIKHKPFSDNYKHALTFLLFDYFTNQIKCLNLTRS